MPPAGRRAPYPGNEPMALWIEAEDSPIAGMVARSAQLPAADGPGVGQAPRSETTLAMIEQAMTEFHIPSDSSNLVDRRPRVLQGGVMSATGTPSDVPSVTTGSSVSTSSVRTKYGKDHLRSPRLDIIGNGQSVASAAPDHVVYECAFSWLDCTHEFDNIDHWKTHSLWHFRGHEPPKDIQCPLCDFNRRGFRNGYDAWRVRLDHVARHHQQGQDLSASRPDFGLIEFLFKKKLLNDALCKRLKLRGAVGNQVTTSTETRRRERRQRP
ncbi:MAG: hypothetical protein Q9162_004230 [Coniocarpon cinnabarinum]